MLERPPTDKQQRGKAPIHFPQMPDGVTLAATPSSLDRRRGVKRYVIGTVDQRFEVEIDIRSVAPDRLARFEVEARFSLLAVPVDERSDNMAVFEFWTLAREMVREMAKDAASSAGYDVDSRVKKDPSVTVESVLREADVDPWLVVHRSLTKIHDALQGSPPLVAGGELLSGEAVARFVAALLRRPGLFVGRWLDEPGRVDARPGVIDVRLRWAVSKSVAKKLPKIWEVYCHVDPWAGPGLVDMFTPRTGSGPTRCWLSVRDWWHVPGAWLQAIFDDVAVVGYPVGSGTGQSGVDATSVSVAGVGDWVQYEWYGWWTQTVDDSAALE